MKTRRVYAKSPIRILLNKMTSAERESTPSPQGLRAILLKVLRRLDEGERVEGRLIFDLEEQGQVAHSAKVKAMLDELRQVLGRADVPMVRSRYAVWASENESLLRSTRAQVEELLSSLPVEI